MARLEFLANCFFLSIGLVLIGAGILVVPSNAFANAGEDCKDNEKCKGLTGADLGSCVATCCAGSTDTDCCAEACFGDDNYTNCKNACSAAAAQCGTYTTPDCDKFLKITDCVSFEDFNFCSPSTQQSCWCLWKVPEVGSASCVCCPKQ